MKLELSEVDRAALATLFLRPGSRGGTAVLLLAQDSLHTLLGIDDFAAATSIPIDQLSTEALELEIPDHLVPVLREMCGWPGQDPTGARIVASVLRRLVT